MNVEVHVALAVVPARAQAVNVPVTPVSVTVTVPVGVMNAPGDVSVTVMVHVEAWLIATGVAQLIVVVVDLRLTTIEVVPLLPLWALSPG